MIVEGCKVGRRQGAGSVPVTTDGNGLSHGSAFGVRGFGVVLRSIGRGHVGSGRFVSHSAGSRRGATCRQRGALEGGCRWSLWPWRQRRLASMSLRRRRRRARQVPSLARPLQWVFRLVGIRRHIAIDVSRLVSCPIKARHTYMSIALGCVAFPEVLIMSMSLPMQRRCRRCFGCECSPRVGWRRILRRTAAGSCGHCLSLHRHFLGHRLLVAPIAARTLAPAAREGLLLVGRLWV